MELVKRFNDIEKLERFITQLENRYPFAEHETTNITFNDLNNNIIKLHDLLIKFKPDSFNDLIDLFNSIILMFEKQDLKDFDIWYQIADLKMLSISENGYFYKDDRDFKHFKDDDIIYISEYDFSEVNSLTNDLFDMNEVIKNKLGATLKDLKVLCNNNKLHMQIVFDMVDWQEFSSLYYELEF